MLIERGVLVHALKSLTTIIDKKAVSPFDHIRLEPAPGGVAITAGDGTMSASLMVPSDGSIDACVPARDLLAAASGADNGDLLALAVHNREVVTVSYSGATARLANNPSFDFRAVTVDGEVGVRRHQTEAGQLGAALAWVSSAMCRDDITRLHMAGVLIDGDQVVATDGHRLHVATIAGLGCDRTLVPSKAIQLLLRLLRGTGLLEVSVHDGALRVATATWSVRTASLDHQQFPPYRQVIPERTAAKITMSVQARDLGAAVHRVGVGRGRQSVPLRMTANGKIVMATTSAEVQRVASVDPTSSTHDDLAGDHVIGIDGRYLRDAVDLKGEVVLRFADALAPIVVDGGARLAVVMPMRL